MQFLLIHGTWARDAKWVEPDSALGRRLAQEFPAARVAEPLPWSGDNTFSARLAAAEMLVQRLQRSAGSRCVLVAHSHGGSVVHYAYRLAPQLFAEQVVGVACMATPFFGFSLRPGYGPLAVAAIVVAAILLLHAGMASLMFASHHLKWGLDDNVPGLLAVAAIYATVVVAVTVAIVRRQRAIYGWLARGAEQLAA